MENISSLKITQANIYNGAKPLHKERQGTGPTEGKSSESVEIQNLEPKEIQALADNLNKALGRTDGNVSVSVDDSTGMVVVRITDVRTGEIVKQVPPQQLLDADVSVEKIIGLLVNDEV